MDVIKLESREHAKKEMQHDCIETPEGVYCISCGCFYRCWDGFLQDHRVKYPWTNPDILEFASV
jgi:hypothetical protein